VRSPLDALRGQLRASSAYQLVRQFSARRQRDELAGLVGRLAATPRETSIEADVQRELAERAPARRGLPERLEDARVISVGARGWERYGLWPSLQRLCGAEHFSDGQPDDAPFQCESRAEQAARGQRLLQFVDASDARAKVHLVLLYADSSNLAPALFDGLRARGIWTVLIGLDDRHTFQTYRRGDLEVGVETVAPRADLYWTSWRAGLLLHRAIGSRAWLGAAAADPAFYHPVEVQKDIDVLFLGQSYGVRREVVETLRARGIAVEARGHGWGGGFVSFEETVRLYSRARIVLGISAVGAMDDVVIPKGRDFEAPMCGACYVTQYVEELTDYFQLGQDLVCWGNPLHAAELILLLLRDEPRRRLLGENALKTSLLNNTWEKRLRDLYRQLPRAGAPAAGAAVQGSAGSP
jgi:hypothetical protein